MERTGPEDDHAGRLFCIHQLPPLPQMVQSAQEAEAAGTASPARFRALLAPFGRAKAQGFKSLPFRPNGPASVHRLGGLAGGAPGRDALRGGSPRDLRRHAGVLWDGTLFWRSPVEFMQYLIAVVIVVAAIAAVVRYGLRRTTVYEFERGLKYARGRFDRILPPGQHWYLPWFTSVRKIDVRPRFAAIAGQEVLSSDGVTLKVSLAANYEVVDPATAVNKVQNFQEALHVELQLALRQIVGATDIDSLLAARDNISKQLADMTQSKAQDLGLRLITVSVKDIMFPGRLKETFAQVVAARKEGQAALEKARGETAALRNLANAAKMLESNPSLMQLRALQTLGGSTGNTLILGLPPQTTVPVKAGSAQNKGTPPQISEQ